MFVDRSLLFLAHSLQHPLHAEKISDRLVLQSPFDVGKREGSLGTHEP